MSTCVSVNEARQRLRSAFRIDGCAVDQVLDDVHRSCWDHAANRGLDLRTQVIAWDPLWAAADREALHRLLSTAIHHVASNTDGGPVHMQAYPTHDDVFVVFEVRNERPARRRSDRMSEFSRMVDRARLEVESMGGEFAEFGTDEGGSRISFRLPQWVS